MSAGRAGGSARRPPRMLPAGRFFGVPIYFAPSWLIIAALITVYYAPIIGDVLPQISSSSAYLLAFAFTCLLAVCVLAHELGHTAVSLLLRHPVRRVVIFLLGGVSEMEGEPDRPRDEFLIAAAGPLVSLLLAGGSAAALPFVEAHTMPGVLVALLLWSNLVVAAFNLLPGLPLDGGRLLRAAVWAVGRSKLTGTRAAGWAGRIIAIGLAIAGLVLDRGQYGLTAGLMTIALAVYLWVAAGHSLRAGELMARVPQLDLERLLRPGMLVPADLSVAEALRRAWSGNVRGLVVVDSRDRPSAIVNEALISAVPAPRRAWTQVGSVARPLEPGLVLQRGLDGEQLLSAVRDTPAQEYLVVNADGSPAGILSAKDLAAALHATA